MLVKKENQRIWVAPGIKERLEKMSDESGTSQEKILGDILDYYDTASTRDLNMLLPELQLTVSVLEMEVGRLIHRLTLLDDTVNMAAAVKYDRQEPE